VSNDNNKKYGRNRNLWRKTYGYSNNKPTNVQLVDQINQVSYSLNLDSIVRHRDYFIIKDIPSGSIYVAPTQSVTYAEYDEGLIPFNWLDGESKLQNFHFTFSANPYVALTVDDDGTNLSNIIAYGISYSTTGVYVGISAPFSGNIRYRAIRAPSYPAYVTSAYTTSYMTASAGSVYVNNAEQYYSIFGLLPGLPAHVYQTAWDSSNNTSDININTEIVTNNYISSSLSAPYSNKIDFIVMTDASSSLGSGFMYTFGFYFGA
jgi:hypothetical protein